MHLLPIIFLASKLVATLAFPGEPRNGNSPYDPEDEWLFNDVGRRGHPDSRIADWGNNNANSGRFGNGPKTPSNDNPFFNNRRYTPGPPVSRFPGMDPHRSVMNPGVVADMDSRRQGTSGTSINSLPDKPTISNTPFEGCERHPMNQDNAVVISNNVYQTKPKPMDHQSIMAVYPMQESNIPMRLTIRMPQTEYQAYIDGSFVELRRCLPHASKDMCEVESETSSKGGARLIDANKWNYIYSQFDDDSVTIGINERVNVMSVTPIPAEQIDDAEWLITSGDITRNDPGAGGNPFVVQYPCAEYVAEHLPPLPTRSPFLPRTNDSSHHEYTTPDYHHHTGAPVVGGTTEAPEEVSGPSPSVIIIIVVVLALIVAAAVAMSISVYRRRNKFKVSENTPLSDQMQQQQEQQQQQ